MQQHPRSTCIWSISLSGDTIFQSLWFLDIGLLPTGKLLNQGSYWLGRSHHFESFKIGTMTWLIFMEHLCHKWPRICSTCRKHFLVLSSFITCHGFVTRLTWRVPLMEQELLTLPEHLSSPLGFSGVRVTRSLVLCARFQICAAIYQLLLHMVFTSRNWFAMQGPVAIILISLNVIFIWETGYWTRAIKRFALFDLLKSLYSDTKILQRR